jgi:hypothetical protein
MPTGQSFVNVGVWNGFTFLTGSASNPDRTCIGVDNFSESGGPREAFGERFERLAGPNHRFYEMDYRDYFSNKHSGPIGVYLYDGEHSYDNQWRGLEIAEPFFADDCVVVVDDTNWEEPHAATLDFLEASRRDYTVLLDRGTAGNGHPTLWNGIMVLQAGRRADGRRSRGKLSSPGSAGERSDPPEKDASLGASSPAGAQRNGRPLVSIIIEDDRADAEQLEAAIESALDQTWPEVEVLAVSPHVGGLDRHGDRVALLPAGDSHEASGILAAVEQSRGSFVSFVDAHRPLRNSAVHMALGYPGFAGFWRNPPGDDYRTNEQLLLASEEVRELIPAGKSFVLVNGGAAMPRTFTVNGMVAFPPGDGHPVDDDSAIRDLEDVRSSNVAVIAFLWPAFGWLRDRYPGLNAHLRSMYPCLLENERVLAFDLQ